MNDPFRLNAKPEPEKEKEKKIIPHKCPVITP
jgi:hypothetical protein